VLLGKRQCFHLETYAAIAKRMCHQYQLRHVFVATDDATVAAGLQRLLPQGSVAAFVSNFSMAKGNLARIEGRLARQQAASPELWHAALEVASDIELLADSAALVGSFLSQVYRLAVELSYFRKRHIIPFASLDITWCYAGSWGRANVTLAHGGNRTSVAC
jgi:hypothetical protein